MKVLKHLTCQLDKISACMHVFYGQSMTSLLMGTCLGGAQKAIRHAQFVMKTYHQWVLEVKYVIWVVDGFCLLIIVGEGVDNMMVNPSFDHLQECYLVMI